MNRKHAIRLAWIGGAVLVLLHLDFWRSPRPEPWFGWLPDELAYRVVFIGMAWAFMLFVCSRIWTEDVDS